MNELTMSIFHGLCPCNLKLECNDIFLSIVLGRMNSIAEAKI
jgi:hypothetical protein